MCVGSYVCLWLCVRVWVCVGVCLWLCVGVCVCGCCESIPALCPHASSFNGWVPSHFPAHDVTVLHSWLIGVIIPQL